MGFIASDEKHELYNLRKEKINVSLSRRILKKIDALKKFPKWKGNRSGLIEEILEDYFDRNQFNIKIDEKVKEGSEHNG